MFGSFYGLTCLVPLILCHYHHRLVLSRSLALLYSCIYPQHSLNMISTTAGFLGVDRSVHLFS